MELKQKDADEVKNNLKSRFGQEDFADVPHIEVFSSDVPAQVKEDWLKANFDVNELAGIFEGELEQFKYKAGLVHEDKELIYSFPHEISDCNNIYSSDELAEIIVSFSNARQEFDNVRKERDRYSNKAEQAEAELERKQEELAEYKNAGRLHHLKRLVLG